MATPRRVRKPMPISGLKSSWPADSIGQNYAANVRNVRFRFGEARPTPGRGLFDRGPVAQTSLLIAPFTQSSGINWPMMLTTSKLYRRGTTVPGTPNVWTEVPGTFTPTGTRRWAAISGEDKFFFCRGAEEISLWDGTVGGNFVKLSTVAGFAGFGGGANAHSCRCMDYFNNRLVTAYTFEGANTFANRIRWAQNGDYRKWDETLQLGAGFMDLFSEGAEDIKQLRALNDRGVIYRLHSISELVPTGNLDQVFVEQVRVRGLGCIAPFTVASNGQIHMFLGTDKNVWMWDGIQNVPLGDPIYEELKALVNVDALDLYFGFMAPQRQEYWLVLSDPTRGAFDVFVYDYVRNYWTRDSFPNITSAGEFTNTTTAPIWSGMVGPWSPGDGRVWLDLTGTQFIQLIAGRTDSATMLIDEQFSYDYYSQGSIIDRYLETEDQYLDDVNGPAGLETIIRILLVYKYVNNIPFEIGVSFNQGSSWDTQLVTPTMSGYTWVEFRATGNVIRYRFRENNANGSFRWRSYVQEFQVGGDFLGTTTA
jgi:hypothetical protein